MAFQFSTTKHESHLSEPTAQGLGMRAFTIRHSPSKLQNVGMHGNQMVFTKCNTGVMKSCATWVVLDSRYPPSFSSNGQLGYTNKWHSQPLRSSQSIFAQDSAILFLSLQLSRGPFSQVMHGATINWILFLGHHGTIPSAQLLGFYPSIQVTRLGWVHPSHVQRALDRFRTTAKWATPATWHNPHKSQPVPILHRASWHFL